MFAASAATTAATPNEISYPNSAYGAEKSMAQLPRNVIPQNYAVSITPNVDNMRVAGSEVVTVLFTEAGDKIQFNSVNQKIAHVLFDGATVQSVQSNEDNQLTTVKLKSSAAIGQHTLSFAFVGKIGNDLHGIFTQPYPKRLRTKGQFLTAQFEGADTHRIFPCWDDPAFKATYQISLTVPNTWTAWSSLPVTQRDVHGEFSTISYQKTSDLNSEAFEFSNLRKLQVPENYIGKN
jgi:aminopeptidase N